MSVFRRNRSGHVAIGVVKLLDSIACHAKTLVYHRWQRSPRKFITPLQHDVVDTEAQYMTSPAFKDSFQFSSV